LNQQAIAILNGLTSEGIRLQAEEGRHKATHLKVPDETFYTWTRKEWHIKRCKRNKCERCEPREHSYDSRLSRSNSEAKDPKAPNHEMEININSDISDSGKENAVKIKSIIRKVTKTKNSVEIKRLLKPKFRSHLSKVHSRSKSPRSNTPVQLSRDEDKAKDLVTLREPDLCLFTQDSPFSIIVRENPQ